MSSLGGSISVCLGGPRHGAASRGALIRTERTLPSAQYDGGRRSDVSEPHLPSCRSTMSPNFQERPSLAVLLFPCSCQARRMSLEECALVRQEKLGFSWHFSRQRQVLHCIFQFYSNCTTFLPLMVNMSKGTWNDLPLLSLMIARSIPYALTMQVPARNPSMAGPNQDALLGQALDNATSFLESMHAGQRSSLSGAPGTNRLASRSQKSMASQVLI